jgi:hypothetical protein
MKEHRLSSFAEFLQIAVNYGDNAHAFRGQGNADWGLKPVLLRHAARLDLGLDAALSVEAVLHERHRRAPRHEATPGILSWPGVLSWKSMAPLLLESPRQPALGISLAAVR